MPNWCKNRLYLTGSAADIDRLLAAIRGDESPMDFDKIIPMPRSLEVETGTRMTVAIDCARGTLTDVYPWMEEKGIDTPEKLCSHYKYDFAEAKCFGQKLLENIQRYGHATWYEWCIQNWGVKWNVVGEDDVQLMRKSPTHAVMRFSTAWAPPIPVVRKLAEMFPRLKIRLTYSEPGIGFSGKLALAGGVEVAHRHDCIGE